MTEPVDVLLIGGGVMSATLGTFISELEPDWTIEVYERLGDVALESSNAWNNAGTGHAALCELNYMPAAADGSVDPAKAISINEQFQQSRQFWSSLVEAGVLDEPSTFINSTPHMTFVRGEKDVAYLKKRYEALKDQPLFAGIEYSEVEGAISALDGVEGVHDLHIWSLTSGVNALSCHVEVKRERLVECEGILDAVRLVVRERFEIDHTTVQIEPEHYKSRQPIRWQVSEGSHVT